MGKYSRFPHILGSPSSYMTFISVREIKTTTDERSCKQVNRQASNPDKHGSLRSKRNAGYTDGQPQLTMRVRVYMKWELGINKCVALYTQYHAGIGNALPVPQYQTICVFLCPALNNFQTKVNSRNSCMGILHNNFYRAHEFIYII